VSEELNCSNYTALCQQGFERGNKPVRLLGLGVRVVPRESEPSASLSKEEQLQLLEE